MYYRMNKILKKDCNFNLFLGDGNDKLVGSDKVTFLTWSIPPRTTCPFKTPVCDYICYAALEELRYTNVKNARIRNYKESLKASFINDMIQLINWQLGRPSIKNKIIIIRIHESGDLYSILYLRKWAAIAEYFKGNIRVLFQAYTKSLPLLKLIDLNATNIKFVYSIMSDTDPANIEEARAMHLTTFEAKHISKVTNNDIVCPGECGDCISCYTGPEQSIIVPLHGARKNKVI